jgi:molybdate/tungstate transport system substrate-binding protein
MKPPRPPAARALALIVAASLAVVTTLAGCGRGDEKPADARLELFTAGALALPLRAAADSFAALRGVGRPLVEAAGSLETVRKLTELHRVPDVVAVADAALIEQLLMPRLVTWYAVFARDRLVLAHTPRSRGASVVDSANWPDVVTRRDVLVGRSDPDRDPAGYRALLAMRLAERHYGRPGLATRLLERAPARLVRPKSADLVGLLQAGVLDYAWVYESVARTAGLRVVRLPDAVNLGDPARAAAYGAESVRVAGAAPGDTLTLVGRPITFALTIPVDAPHPAAATRFVAWLLGADGRRVLAGAGVDLLPAPLVVGGPVPAGLVLSSAGSQAGHAGDSSAP